jgi:hypothetical protein
MYVFVYIICINKYVNVSFAPNSICRSITLDFVCQVVVTLQTGPSFPSNFHVIMLDRFDVFNTFILNVSLTCEIKTQIFS